MEPQSMPKAAKLLKKLVDLEGLEPSTSSMPWKRAPSCATGPLGIAEASAILTRSRAAAALPAASRIQPIRLVRYRHRLALER